MSQENRIEVSVVSPMHNEEATAREFVRRADAALRTVTESYEIVVVNDASADRTAAILRELCVEFPRLRVIHLARNRGQCIAIYAGFQESRGQYVVVMDSDLQHLPEEIPALVREIRKGYDLVSGTRRGRTESLLLRRIPSLIANWLLRATTGCSARDMGGFKCLRGEIARNLRLRAGQHRLLPALVHMLGGSIGEVPIAAPPRTVGKSHYGISRVFDVFFDILLLWFQSSFKSRPLYLFGRFSLTLFLFGSAIIAWLLVDKFIFGTPMGSRPPFMFAVLFLIASFGFIATGFVLELLSETQQTVSGAKPYMIRERWGSPDGESGQDLRDRK
ncbi:MAG: glycosyltransferase family 2 protein [Candidatus Sumerlaeota bacterium]|nr:glycosyltransferase family 2 protein [Candidatus Sumerlaeota bacterium]